MIMMYDHSVSHWQHIICEFVKNNLQIMINFASGLLRVANSKDSVKCDSIIIHVYIWIFFKLRQGPLCLCLGMPLGVTFCSKLGPVSLTNFLPTIEIRWKLCLAVIPFLAIRSQQIFAHATTAVLCHVQKFVAITVLYFWWEWNEISIEFELRWKKR